MIYCANFYLCSEDLERICTSNLNRIGIDFQSMLYETVCSGNTMLITSNVRNAMLRPKDIDGVYRHDWWAALVVMCLGGEIVFDSSPVLDYRRIESGNVSAGGKSGFALFVFRFRKFISGDGLNRITEQLRLLLGEFGDEMSEDNRALLNRCLEGSCFSKAIVKGRFRQSLSGEAAVRLLLLMGRL